MSKILVDDTAFKVLYNTTPGYYRFIYKGTSVEQRTINMIYAWQTHAKHYRSPRGFTEEEVRNIIKFYKDTKQKTLSLETELWLAKNA